MQKRSVLCALIFSLSWFATASNAAGTGPQMAYVDFESLGAALGEGGSVTSTTAGGVTVNFSTEDGNGIYTPIIAQAGVATSRVGFQSVLGDDTPVDAAGNIYAAGGDYSLTDGIRITRDYVFDFSSPVINFSLDLYDFRADGTYQVGVPGSDTVDLLAYDAAGNVLGSTAYVVSDPRPIDGNVVTLAIGDLGNISQVRLDFSTIEGGTSVDNLSFLVPESVTAVPEPQSIGLFAMALAGLFLRHRRQC